MPLKQMHATSERYTDILPVRLGYRAIGEIRLSQVFDCPVEDPQVGRVSSDRIASPSPPIPATPGNERPPMGLR